MSIQTQNSLMSTIGNFTTKIVLPAVVICEATGMTQLFETSQGYCNEYMPDSMSQSCDYVEGKSALALAATTYLATNLWNMTVGRFSRRNDAPEPQKLATHIDSGDVFKMYQMIALSSIRHEEFPITTLFPKLSSGTAQKYKVIDGVRSHFYTTLNKTLEARYGVKSTDGKNLTGTVKKKPTSQELSHLVYCANQYGFSDLANAMAAALK